MEDAPRQRRPSTAPPQRHGASLPERWPETGCQCRDCQLACLNSPGWFVPEEVPRLARFLGLEVPELFRRYLGLSVTVLDDGQQRRGVMPHKLRDRKQPGGGWTLDELAVEGRCVFYDRGRCSIYPVRPFECARMSHAHSPARTSRLRAAVAATWTTAALAPFVALVRAAKRSGRRR